MDLKCRCKCQVSLGVSREICCLFRVASGSGRVQGQCDVGKSSCGAKCEGWEQSHDVVVQGIPMIT